MLQFTIRKSSSFLSVRGYTNNYGEVSNFTVNFRASYKEAVKKSLATLGSLDLRALEAPEKGITHNLLVQARREIADSLEASLEGNNARYTCPDTYQDLAPGVKLEKSNQAIHIWGLLLSKDVVTPGTYPARNKRALTRAKDALRKELTVSRFRQYKLVPGKFEAVRVDGHEVTPK